MISNAHPYVHSNILVVSQPSEDTTFTIISGAVSNISGIVELNDSEGGTGPGFITPTNVS